MNTIKSFNILFILIILINNSIGFQLTENELKYWEVFQSWCNAYGKSYDQSVIQDKFISFKDNFDRIVKENALNNSPFVTITYEYQLKSYSIKRKLLDVEDITQVEVLLPSNYDFQVKSLNQFSDLSHNEFISYYTGLEGGDITIIDPVEVGTNELSSGQLAGIIIGSVIGGLIIIFSIAIISIKIIKRKSQENKIKKVFKGVNLYELKPGQHQSITGRGVPINLN